MMVKPPSGRLKRALPEKDKSTGIDKHTAQSS